MRWCAAFWGQLGKREVALVLVVMSCLGTSPFSVGAAANVQGAKTTTILLPGGVPLEMVTIPAGSFQMGANENDLNSSDGRQLPTHGVNIGYSFQMGRFEVTQRQWLAVMGGWPKVNLNYYLPKASPDANSGTGDNYPAFGVSWNEIREARGYLDKLNQHVAATGQGLAAFRLPSESEWEYACRAGSSTQFCFGNSNCGAEQCDPLCNLGDYAWFCGNNGMPGSIKSGAAKPVGGKLPNAFGIHDMHGNVREWCEDSFHPSYSGAPKDGSAWVSPPTPFRVLRGGMWSDYPRKCRSAFRDFVPPTSRGTSFGFRLVRTQR